MKKYNYKILSIGIAFIGLLVLGIIGLTYAFFTAGVEGNQNATDTVIETADLRLVYSDTQVITMDDALPGAIASKTFTVQNIGNVNISYDVTITDVTNTFINDELVYTITSDNGGGTVTNEPMPTDEDILLSSSIDPGITQTYTIQIKFKETGADQNANQGAEFSGKLQIDAGIKYVSIGGYVYDENENVLSNVTVEIHSDPIITTTNSEGYYEIENIPTGQHTMYIKNGETILGTRTINIKQNETVSIKNNTLKIPSEYKNVNIKVEEEIDINIEKKNALTIWKKNFGGSSDDSFSAVIQTTDGGYVAVGYIYSTDIIGITNKGGKDAILVKYDSSGNQVWSKNFGGSGADSFSAVIQTTDGGYVVVGESNSTNISGITNTGGIDAIIVKYDSSGTEVWKKNFGGSDRDSFRKVIATTDGGYVAIGSQGPADYLSSTAVIVKYSSNGTKSWNKSFGGNNYTSFLNLVLTTDNQFVVTGFSTSTNISGLTNKGGQDAIMVKYNSSGTEVWKKNFGGSKNDNSPGIILTTDEGYIVIVRSESTDISDLTNKGGQDAIMVKYDSSGTEIWKKNFGGNGSDSFENTIQTLDGGYMVVGYSASTDISGFTNKGTEDAIILKYDSSGNELWKKNFGGTSSDKFFQITQKENGIYLAVGYSSSVDISGITNNGGSDGLIVAFSK